MQLKKVSVNDIITAKYQMLKMRRGVRFNTLKGTPPRRMKHFGTAKKDIDGLAQMTA